MCGCVFVVCFVCRSCWRYTSDQMSYWKKRSMLVQLSSGTRPEFAHARASAEAYTKVKHMLQLIRTWVTRQTGVYVGSTSLLCVWWRPAVWFTRARYESVVGLGHTEMNLVSPKLSLDLIIHKYQVNVGCWVSNTLSPVHRKGYIQ